MEHLFSSYQSSLDSLIFDTAIETNNNSKPLDMETKANLELWTNVQFTYDIQPGSGLLDDSIKSPLTAVSSPTTSIATSSSSPSNITYESLANYLDFELPQQHLNTQIVEQKQQQQQLPPQQQKSATPQLLLPKILPNTTLEEITKILFTNIPNASATASTNTNTAVTTSSSTSKIPITSITAKSTASPAKVNKEKSAIEEDKRKRNTAASARFRIKKKQREQSMEKTVREMTEKSTGLENRVKELELEIKFLRGLLIEKKQGSQEH